MLECAAAETADISGIAARRSMPARWVLLCCAVVCASAFAQNPPPAGQSQSPAEPKPDAPKPQTDVQKIPTVTTTVVVHGEAKNDYSTNELEVGSLGGIPATLQETPLSVTIATRAVLNDQGARVLSDVVKNDASIGEDYAPVGYYGDFEIRGFTIDLATGIEVNGMTVAGEQDVPLENKERVEFLKGVAGVESGVASAGGLINFVTKRPALVEAADLATDHRGTAYGAVDLGHLFGSQKQLGVRFNLAGERIESYVQGTDGWRGMGAGTADWKLNPKAILKTDFEYQHKVQRSVCGYQLLGGTTVPDLDRISPTTLLGEQAWAKPNTFDTYNTGARFDYGLPHAWRASAAASFSHSLIDDNVVYAYGCGYEAECQGSGGSAPAYFFAPDGGFDIYDYRDPGELRIDALAEALLMGRRKTGAIAHEFVLGAEMFRRSVQQPGAPPANAPTTVQDGAVYTYVGSENIYQPDTGFPIESPYQTAGPRTLWEDNHQSAALLQDRIRLPGRIQLLAAGRYDSLRDHNYSLAATSPGTAPTNTDKPIWLPQYAATSNPSSNLTLYGNYGVMLSLGPQGPWWVADANQFLQSYLTRQAEVGAKYNAGQRILLSTALFHMRAPFFYPKEPAVGANCSGETTTATAPLCFLQEGRETHDGIELNAEGKAANWLQLTASAMAIRAISGNTGTPSFDEKQVINVPHLHTAMFADVLLPHAHGLHLMPGWSYTGRKEATRDDRVSVSGYNLFNLGARYTPGGENGRVTLRLYADNIFDKRYWKDTGASYGDTFIHLGAPTTVRLSAHYTF
jgi:iron complex outermembrane receptor protein